MSYTYQNYNNYTGSYFLLDQRKIFSALKSLKTVRGLFVALSGVNTLKITEVSQVLFLFFNKFLVKILLIFSKIFQKNYNKLFNLTTYSVYLRYFKTLFVPGFSRLEGGANSRQLPLSTLNLNYTTFPYYLFLAKVANIYKYFLILLPTTLFSLYGVVGVNSHIKFMLVSPT
jgi:hypothetical protein